MKLYVGNLPFSVTTEDLRNMFEEKGFSVQSANVIEDRATGRSRGFGFVETDRGEEAISAFSTVSMEGRTLTVNEARPQPDRGSGGGGGGGRRFDDRRGGGRGDRGDRGGRGGRY